MGLALTKAESIALLALARAGYVLRKREPGWEIGQLQGNGPTLAYNVIIPPCPTPAAALKAAKKHRLPTQ